MPEHKASEQPRTKRTRRAPEPAISEQEEYGILSHRVTPPEDGGHLVGVYDINTLYQTCHETSKRLRISLPPVVAVAYAALCSKHFGYIYGNNPFFLTKLACGPVPVDRALSVHVTTNDRKTGSMTIVGYPDIDSAVESFYKTFQSKVPYLSSFLLDETATDSEGNLMDMYPNVYDAAASLHGVMKASWTVYPSLAAFLYTICALCTWTFPEIDPVGVCDYIQFVTQQHTHPAGRTAPKSLEELFRLGAALCRMSDVDFRVLRYRAFRAVPEDTLFEIDNVRVLFH